jgi:hypothetical protein
MKKTLSMRKLADPRETEMFEKCDLADAVERMQIKEKKAEHDKVTGFYKLLPLIRPKWVIGLALLFLVIATIKSVSTGLFMGKFMAILSTPFDLIIL